MKQYVVIAVLSASLFSSCKKDKTGNGQPITASKNTPNLICLAYPQSGQPVNINAFNFYDLDHDDNKDKKYFTVELFSSGVDSVRVIMEPKPIDSLSANWPATIKKIRWGSGAEFIVDNESFIRITGGNFYQIQYNQASPQHAWLSRYKNTIAAVSLPNAEVTLPGGEYKLFYFVDRPGLADVFAYQNASGSYYRMSDLLNAMGQAFNAYDWRDVTHLIWLHGQTAFYFFDFKNWRYWRIDKRNGIGQEWVGTAPKSLDRFVKWPQGWGKK
jgi:hypothetical protein